MHLYPLQSYSCCCAMPCVECDWRDLHVHQEADSQKGVYSALTVPSYSRYDYIVPVMKYISNPINASILYIQDGVMCTISPCIRRAQSYHEVLYTNTVWLLVLGTLQSMNSNIEGHSLPNQPKTCTLLRLLLFATANFSVFLTNEFFRYYV